MNEWMDFLIFYHFLKDLLSKLLQYCWPYSLCCILQPHNLLIIYWWFVLLNPLTLPPSIPLSAGTHLFSVSMNLFSFCLSCFLDSTYKWDDVVFVFDLFRLAWYFLDLLMLQMARIHFFNDYYSTVYIYVYIYTHTHTHTQNILIIHLWWTPSFVSTFGCCK